MLRKEAVVPEVIKLLKELQNNNLFNSHILVGGTALALQLGHRTSTDIDLFTDKPQDTKEIIDYFNKNYKDVDPIIEQDDFIRIIVNGIKIELVHHDDFNIKPLEEEGIRYSGINEIAAMKLKSIRERTEPRDFIDIAYLLKEIPLEKMFETYRETIGRISPLLSKRTLLEKCKSINEEGWILEGIKLLRNDIKPENVYEIISQAIDEYNIKYDIGKQKEKITNKNEDMKEKGM